MPRQLGSFSRCNTQTKSHIASLQLLRVLLAFDSKRNQSRPEVGGYDEGYPQRGYAAGMPLYGSQSEYIIWPSRRKPDLASAALPP
jgi:hypothetical protein